MRPALEPGDGLVAVCAAAPYGPASCGCSATRGGPRAGSSSGSADVYGTGSSAIFEARSDNPKAPGAVDSHEFGWVPAADSYRVVWTIRAPAPSHG